MLKNIALTLKPEQYQRKLTESVIEKNSWKKSLPLYRSLRLDIYPGHETSFHLFESHDKVRGIFLLLIIYIFLFCNQQFFECFFVVLIGIQLNDCLEYDSNYSKYHKKICMLSLQ